MNIVNLSESVKTAVRVAQSLAKEYHHKEFGPAHLLKGLMHQEVGLKNLLQSIGKDTAYISDWAEVRIEDYSAALTVPDEMLGNDQVKQVFEEADNVRIKLGQDLIMPVCVLIALIKPNVGFDANQLKSFPVKERELLDIYLSNEDVNHAVNPSAQATNGSEAPNKLPRCSNIV